MRDYWLIFPQVATGALALIVLAADLIYRPRRKEPLGGLAAVGLLLILAVVVALGRHSGRLFGGLFIGDGLSFIFYLIFLVGALLVALASVRFAGSTGYAGEYYALVLFSTVGLMFMVASGDLLTLYLSLELSTIPLYALAAFLKRDARSGEAGLKYLLLGAVSTAVLIYGISLVYGIAGTTALRPLGRLVATGPVEPALLLALAFIAAGFAFKISSVPFHMWAPDVYEGAPTPIVAFAAAASKAGGFAVILRVFAGSFPAAGGQWLLLMAAMSALSMIVGNTVAIPQTNIKRMLAYSGIAQAGYVLVGVAAASGPGAQAAMYYLFQYTFTVIGAFTVVLIVARSAGNDEIASYAGLAQRSPVLAMGMLLLLLSLGGIPPLSGFWAKIYVFAAGIQQGLWWLVLIGVLASVVSLYYYLMVVKQMYIAPPRDRSPVAVPWPAGLAVVICVLAILALAYPAPILDLAARAASALF
jgi:NADH-quinone oxidoreductase subunit N